MNIRLAFSLGLMLLWASSAWATPTIVLEDYKLLPDTPDQRFSIYVGGGDQIESARLVLQVADGGPLHGGSILGPTIQSIDMITGTIFFENNLGFSEYPHGQIYYCDTMTKLDTTVAAEGLLATVTISTVGFTSGMSWDLKMTGTQLGDSGFCYQNSQLLPASITNGQITLVGEGPAVPEPGSLALFGLGGLALLWLARRR